LLYSIELPSRARLRRHNGRAPASLHSSQEIGRAWAEDGSTFALAVPSVLVPQETNYVLNARHPQFARLRAAEPEPFSFDERLWP